MSNEDFFDSYTEVIDLYRHNKSINKVVEQTNLSQVKVRKILITAGLWSSKTSIEIAKHLKEGRKPEEIAEILNVTVDSVHAYTPYQKSIYRKKNKSPDADRAGKYRERKTKAHKAQSKKFPSIKDKNGRQIKERINKMTTNKQASQDSERKILHLHLELMDEWLDPEFTRVIKEYGKSPSGKFTRDFMIPSDMTLHALNYAILRSFGWQNSHLHSFSLTDNDFDFYTRGMFKNWTDLCGAIFRFPTDNFEDLYWDDDYDGNESHKSWLRRKYTGPYEYLGLSESYGVARKEIAEFYKRFPTVKVKPPFRWGADESPEKETEEERIVATAELSIDEMNRAIIFEEGFNTLMENLEITNILAQDKTGDLPDDKWINHIKELASAVESGERELNEKSVIPGIKPFVREIIYRYDYGDNWEVSIKCKDIISESSLEEKKKEGTLMIPSQENQVTWSDVENAVLKRHRPICIAREGMNLVDDVGGLRGFCDLLNVLYGDGEEEDGIDLRTWAKSMGWSARVPSPKTTL